MKKLLAVDGNSLINRAFYGVKPLTTRDGKNTGAVFGFINMLKSHLDSINPDYAAVAFDLKGPTFRHQKYDFYKANRTGMPPELAEQFEDCKKAAECMGFHKITAEGFEADDILGTLSTLGNKSIQVYILTGDRDSYQLVSDNVTVLYLSTKETVHVDKGYIDEKYGVRPQDLIEVKALMGDKSDNIPGVMGIGEKTALDLVKKYSTVENLYSSLENAENITKGTLQKLQNGREMAFASRFLAEIDKNAPINLDISTYEYCGIKKAELCRLCEELELNSIINRLSLRECNDNISLFETKLIEYTGIQNVAEISADTLSLVMTQSELYIDDGQRLYKAPKNKENLEKIFLDSKKYIILQDVKSKILSLAEFGIDEIECGFYDVMLASYVVDPSSVISDETLFSAYGTDGVDVSDEEQKNLLALKNLAKLREELDEKIEKAGQKALLYEMEFPLAKILADMEKCGFLVDKNALLELKKELDEDISQREKTIRELSGCNFNINSPKQLGEVLFERMGLPVLKKSKKGYSTDAETLEKLRVYTPIIDEILAYRSASKLKSTYAEGLSSAIAEDGRLHTNFKQAFTLTGRLSSADPNLQNIPIRTEEGRKVRRVFIPEKGKVLVDADYSQIELRIMAVMSGDENMIETYRNGGDIHTTTASQVFGVEPCDVTPDMRKKAKAINFGIIYGIGDFSLAGDMKVSRKEAGEYIERYFERFPKVKQYLDNVKKKAYEDGFVTTLFGRRRYIPELSGRIYMQRMFGERVAMNAPIQGTAADVIKLAMIRVYDALKKQNLDAKLILQVHDELIIECAEDEAQNVKALLEKEMERAAELSVPLSVSAQVGYNWEACHN